MTIWNASGPIRAAHPSTLRRNAASGALERIRPGAYVASADRSTLDRHRLLIEATAPRLGRSTVISHHSAAVLHELPIWRARLGPVTVIRTTSKGNRTKYLHARGGVLAPDEVTLVSELPTTSLARTTSDLASVLPFGEALAVADAALARGLAADAIVPSGKAMRRVARVRACADGRSESPGESMSRALILSSGLPIPVLQHPVYDGGALVARADFAWPSERVIGEFDGIVKYDGTYGDPATAIEAEKRREWRLRDLGWTVVRWGWRDLQHPARVPARLRAALSAGIASRRRSPAEPRTLP